MYGSQEPIPGRSDDISTLYEARSPRNQATPYDTIPSSGHSILGCANKASHHKCRFSNELYIYHFRAHAKYGRCECLALSARLLHSFPGAPKRPQKAFRASLNLPMRPRLHQGVASCTCASSARCAPDAPLADDMAPSLLMRPLRCPSMRLDAPALIKP